VLTTNASFGDIIVDALDLITIVVPPALRKIVSPVINAN